MPIKQRDGFKKEVRSERKYIAKSRITYKLINVTRLRSLRLIKIILRSKYWIASSNRRFTIWYRKKR